jgi:Cu/Ag efflux pump CusA
MSKIPGVVDLKIEAQIEISQIRLEVDRKALAEYGLAPGDMTKLLETAYKGRVVSQVLDEDRWFGLVVWYDESARNNPAVIQQTILDTPSGRKVALGQVARVLDTTGPNTIMHENVLRRIVISCNVADRDLGSVVADIQTALKPVEEQLRTLPGSYRIEYGGQFEAQQSATFRLGILAIFAVIVVFILLWKCLDSWVAAFQVLLVNIPLAAIGSVIALMLVNWPSWDKLHDAPWYAWPKVWAEATTLSVAHWVGFITLIGIVCRNGIMMISHYIHLMKHEGEQFDEKMIIRGSLERLAPVLMTAICAMVGLIPLALGAGQTGKEILYPVALVVLGGLLDSTIMDQVVTPAVFFLFGKTFGPGIYFHKEKAETEAQELERTANEQFPDPPDGTKQTADSKDGHFSPARDTAVVGKDGAIGSG